MVVAPKQTPKQMFWTQLKKYVKKYPRESEAFNELLDSHESDNEFRVGFADYMVFGKYFDIPVPKSKASILILNSLTKSTSTFFSKEEGETLKTKFTLLNGNVEEKP